MILGIDEAGRGPWAGPLVVGAVVLGDQPIEGLTDSKKLSKKRRESLEVEILEKARAYGLGWVEASELDEIGMSAALVLATKRAVEQIKVPYHEIIIDGTINFLKDTSKGAYVTTMPKADLLIPSVSAASILAKVARDRYMTQQDDVYPGYKFASHAGYGTAAHREAIERLGVTPIHRLSFAPLRKYAPPTLTPILPIAKAYARENVVTTKHIGDAAEDEAAQYLQRHGHEILDRNWKTKYCEIDIVSSKNDIIYFTEVKYRKHSQQGDGLAAITVKKLAQMKFAASFYAQTKCLGNCDLRLQAAALTGQPPEVTELVEITS